MISDRRRSVVTGGLGFIGSHLVDALLERGDEVLVIDNMFSSTGEYFKPGPRCGLSISSVVSQKAVEAIVLFQPDTIYHLAAQISVRESLKDPTFDAHTNVVGTVNMLHAAELVGANFVFSSSGGAKYGSDAPVPTDESHVPSPESPYGVAKEAVETYFKYYHARGMNIASLGFANVYGPRQNPHGEAGVVAIFIGKLANNEEITIYGDGEQTRDYVYVDDIVEALMIGGNHFGYNYANIGTSVETSVNQLLDFISEAMGKRVPVVFEPLRDGEQARSALSWRHASAVFGWEYATSIRSGIRLTVESEV